MKYLVDYREEAGIPARENFTEYTLADLLDKEFAEQFADPTWEEAKGWSEWGRDNFKTSQLGYARALDAARRGLIVLVAQDDDGYWFATK